MKQVKEQPRVYKRDYVFMRSLDGEVVEVGTSQEELTRAMVAGFRQVAPPEKKERE